MQDRYVGDVGDFAKYALLRRLGGLPQDAPVRLGVVWCLFPDETHNADGRHLAYLDTPEFQSLDNVLIAALRTILETGQRRVFSVLSSGILPVGTVSCHEPVSPPRPCSQRDRLLCRSAWLARCFELTGNCDLVFFDPDNGLEVGSVPKHHPRAGKYIFWDELLPFWDRGQVLLIYHHLNRTAPAARQIGILSPRFTAVFDRAEVLPLVFRRGSSRVFWLVHRGMPLGGN